MRQVAEAIARYYNNGRLGPVTTMLRTPPPYGYLTDLKKLREGILIGVNETWNRMSAADLISAFIESAARSSSPA